MSFKLQKQVNKTISEDGGKEKKSINKVSMGDSLGLMTSDLFPSTHDSSLTHRKDTCIYGHCVCVVMQSALQQCFESACLEVLKLLLPPL